VNVIMRHGAIVPFKRLKAKPFSDWQGLQRRHLWRGK
jgi:hypothetical protein